MDELLSKYESVSKADLHELLGLDITYTDEKWGWVNLDDAGVKRVRSGYLLELPRLESLR